MSTITHAMILAAGLGTRMRPLTETLPKPLIPVAGRPLLDYSYDWLKDAGVKRLVINTSYRASQIEDYIAHKGWQNAAISREEPSPLETGGGIAKALPLLGAAPFLAMNSDAILVGEGEHPVHRLHSKWTDKLDFLMLVVARDQAIGWAGNGDFIVDADGRLRRPNKGEDAPYIFTGVEIMHPRVFDNCPSGAFSLSTLWNKRQQADGWFDDRIHAVIHDGAWLNVGDLAGLASAEQFLQMPY